ncbi:CheR family methyltransferase [Nocardioides daeguensis]|uniref:Protein-glutamate O-methyltransferase CheR n=1 Tax=Nocardioides daeguensis TaxID=908359 RepID=A0ABP6VED2_9ACTN|nr:protein-glutamate O-methyltransferase CheR [Nocardioides daeguensis]MBV6726113.1 protein-glutamate O-methyltransferase CheR [Nocardioides daeguensis]MCR1771956.1 protein-glutamate O-methyltransferase CheR [Nocardioides daeguensis]
MTTSTAFASVSALVRRETSMVYDEGKEYLVEARLNPLAAARGLGLEEYVARLAFDADERRKVVDALTINETSWFRDHTPYQAFTDAMLPALLERRQITRRLRIWSAACSSGQEAYSIAMLLDQHLPPGWSYEIVATDISTAMLERVRAGRYSQVEVNRGLPATSLVRYFTRVGRDWEITERLRERVTVKHLNLAAPYVGLGSFDVIWLRNVLIYFEAATKQDILRRMLPMLADDGYLLLGSSETTLDMPADLAAAWQREQIGRVPTYRRASAARSLTPSLTSTGA